MCKDIYTLQLCIIFAHYLINSTTFEKEILKLGGEAMIPYLARLLDITMNNGTLPGDWKRATVIPIHKGVDRSLVTNYTPVSLTSVVCKQMEHVMASYLRLSVG